MHLLCNFIIFSFLFVMSNFAMDLDQAFDQLTAALPPKNSRHKQNHDLPADINSLTPVGVHEITYRKLQRIDRDKMPKLWPDYYSDGEETNKYHCTRSKCVKLVFDHAQDLKAHYEQEHKLFASYECSTCRKSLDTKSLLKDHMKTHDFHFCQKCHKEFQNRSALNRHLREVDHPLCPQCKKMFPTEVALIRHLREVVHKS